MENKQEIIDYIKGRALDVDAKINSYLTDKTSTRYLETLLGRSGYMYDSKALLKAVIEPAKYLLDLGGKRWRPVLMLAVIDAFGKDSNEYLEFSIIPEVVHNATLIHDDIEDRSETRRGSPAVHIKYGVDVALNLGDFMFYFPVVALLDSKKIQKDAKIRLLEIYQKEMLKVTIGQATDIAWHNFLVDPLKVTESEYMQMAYSKTGVLSSMAAKLGAVLGGADEKTTEIFGTFGASIGVAFQLQDDILNVLESGVSESKGGVGDDITEGKITLLTIYTLAKADEQDRKRLVEILKMHTTDKTLIGEAIKILNKYGAIDYAKNLEQKLISDAWVNVDKMIPESKAKDTLKSMTEFLINRSI
jgi:geranylgeranyl diphosphate synthase, type I